METDRLPREKTSGLETVPRILKRPIWRDRLFWIAIATALFWALVIYLLAF